jgi:hypothetical protein
VKTRAFYRQNLCGELLPASQLPAHRLAPATGLPRKLLPEQTLCLPQEKLTS